ncbi:hypothetical protein METBIDRAFT_135132 [Metschnikowia bicuspidata var. bicuspidata NRRL YB-4993]|uniref:TATA-binding protein-associated factor mot1 n=1 Tax=Metschnikowia bicuspidata var. bicuspidata NRRL YB-4993 TaxID=869754 RepID=A0A1A0HKP3_9ASCO|nr:hypothetical protein METBIDRAFT_135132 [Metschnikowia bicuspidata var. bicuspidata NRRL YB-4993]OBA24561.1 hypothetical protein METBIDRAFT_135132 [Metschnikowia bicuspidata var. bicuspidata NRRL YB-4993]
MSRLDRLVILLETGSTPFIRNTAADQLSDLAKSHPEDIISLLGRVYPFLKSDTWETRIAAARAFGGIVNHAPKWDPNSPASIEKEKQFKKLEENSIVKEEEEPGVKLEQDEELRKLNESLLTLVSFDAWDLQQLLKSGKKLLASGGLEYSSLKSDSGGDTLLNKLKKHKAVVKTEKVISPEVAQVKNEEDSTIKSEPKSDAVTPEASTKSPAASARLKAMQRRRAKVNAKCTAGKIAPVDLSQSSLSRKLSENGDYDAKSQTENPAPFDLTLQEGGSKLMIETKAAEFSPLISQHAKVIGLVWQFQGVYELLLNDLFHDKWEVRHGSALGLRELVRAHGDGAGRIMNKTKEENDFNNLATLQDLAVRLCTLFALDRFADYVNDTVVAPVRESGAQTLAALLLHLDTDTTLKTFEALKSLVLQLQLGEPDSPRFWEAKHGGMLGVRYFVSVRTEVLLSLTALIDSVVLMVLHCLKESEDDVQSVAALTLAPIANEFVKTRTEVVKSLLEVVWDCLSSFEDDLSASIGSVMDLLSKLCTHGEVIQIMQSPDFQNSRNSFETLVPKLFPFLRHPITNVRRATLKTILEFLDINDSTTKQWISSKAVRLLFQNLLVEQNPEILNLSKVVFDKLLVEIERNDSLRSLESYFVPHLQPLMTLIMTPIGIARHNYQMNASLLMKPSGFNFANNEVSWEKESENDTCDSEATELPVKRGRKRKADTKPVISPGDELRINIDAPMHSGDVMFVGYDIFIATRVAAALAFGKALSKFKDKVVIDRALDGLKLHLSSPHATPRLFTAIIIEEYANLCEEKTSLEVTNAFTDVFIDALTNNGDITYYRELVPTLKSVRTACLQLFDVFTSRANLSSSKLPQLPVVVQGEAGCGSEAFGIESASKIVDETYPKLVKTLSASNRISANQALEDSKHRITVALNEARIASSRRSTSIYAAYAAAVLAVSGVPKKLNPIIRSIMESIKQEETLLLHQRTANSMAHLIGELNKIGKKAASDKILKNLCAFLCVDTSEVPEFIHNAKLQDKILSLRKEEATKDPADVAAHERAVFEAKIKRSGALLTLEQILLSYGDDLFQVLPKLEEILFGPLQLLEKYDGIVLENESEGQSIIDALGVLRAILPQFSPKLQQECEKILPKLLFGLKSKLAVFRYSSSKCFSALCAVLPSKSIPFMVKSILPMLNNASEFRERQGAIETVYHVTSTMGSDILPYIVFLIVPVMGRMSDADQDVRVLASTTFASIIKLVPLEAGIPDPPDMPEELLTGRDREREFIKQMMDPTKIAPFELPVAIKATLRKYQQDGVNWLAFLNKYHLHGILCDDMGLGKTLQTICIVASDHHIRAEKYEQTNSDEYKKVPSLVICPPSLTGHWEQELNQYAPLLKVVVYAGGPTIRASIRPSLFDSDVVVTSYDVCRNDADILSELSYNYCVLDEGHIIKNSASKLSKAVKQIRAGHRLILSGTPIQNNVLELWSLFDFLMPGFLGTEKHFMEKFAKPIAASRNSKTSSREQEAGALALESLHKQVLPFMLRRLKEDVLSDLPPKIIQDYYCELSDLQKILYKDFVSKQKTVIEEEITKENPMDTVEDNSKTHIFQILQYMRKLCNHPALVMTPNHPQAPKVTEFLKENNCALRSIEHAPKLTSLKTILLECGIGVRDSEFSGSRNKAKQKQQQLVTSEGVISEHRALIFCQLKDMLDIVEDELFKRHMPSVTYMRLDGKTDPRNRQAIVRKFNEDPSIDVLLLTTKVGGLGLNLTGADTVIFVEHDWNPMNDLQAMDRAHRLGQKKVVNVYRLITKSTLEEKIMGLQKFKMNIASTIVNQQNAGLASMDTNQLLDLFDVDENAAKMEVNGNDKKDKNIPEDLTGGLVPSDAVGEMGQLWDEAQYEDEYNLDNFIKTLK